MKFIIEILLTGLAILIAARIVPDVSISGYGTALLVGILLGLVNATIGLLLRILTFPLNFLTLGLVSFLIGVCMILLVSHWLRGFYIAGFLPAVLFAIVLSLIKMLFHTVEKKS